VVKILQLLQGKAAGKYPTSKVIIYLLIVDDNILLRFGHDPFVVVLLSLYFLGVGLVFGGPGPVLLPGPG